MTAEKGRRERISFDRLRIARVPNAPEAEKSGRGYKKIDLVF